MQIIKSIPQFQKTIRQKKLHKNSIGFVPTMGALHEGHLSLIRKARRENDIVVVSIFVNPTQFGPTEDFTSYPRQKNKDILLTKKEKVDIIFYPSVKTIYPDRYLTYVEVGSLGGSLCGRTRPGHFRGVATVVNKLLNIVQPDRLYLGQKDAQQCVIIKQMAQDLNIPVTVKVCPIVRETDGLALSSRNKYLNAKQRKEAPVLYQSLKAARRRIRAGTRDPKVVKREIRKMIKGNTAGKIEYIECVDPVDLKSVKRISKAVLIALAVKFGKARLIDNIIVRP